MGYYKILGEETRRRIAEIGANDGLVGPLAVDGLNGAYSASPDAMPWHRPNHSDELKVCVSNFISFELHSAATTLRKPHQMTHGDPLLPACVGDARRRLGFSCLQHHEAEVGG